MAGASQNSEHEIIENKLVAENGTNAISDDHMYNGDWETPKEFLDKHPEAVRVRTSEMGKTALHVAITGRESQPEHEILETKIDVGNETNTVPDDQTQGLTMGSNEHIIEQSHMNVVCEFKECYEQLFIPVYRGDWEKAKEFLDKHPEAVRVRTSGMGKNALHVAVTEERLHIVEGLVAQMTVEDMEMERNDGFTALAAAIEVGNLEIAKCLIKKNEKLISSWNRVYGLPVQHAILTGQNHMVRYLYDATPDHDLLVRDEGRHGATLLSRCIYAQHFDIALHLLERAPFLAITDDALVSPLFALAPHSKVFPSGSSLNFWQRWIYRCIHVPPDCITGHISSDIQNQQDSQRDQNDNRSRSFLRCKHGIHIPDCTKSQNQQDSQRDQNDNRSKNFLRYKHVLFCLLQWVLLKLFDINGNIYKTKLLHAQSLAVLKRMCMVIEGTSDEKKTAGVHEALIVAAGVGNVEFLSGIAKANPTLVWNPHIARRVFEVAVESRQAKIFSLIYGLRNKIAIVSYHEDKGSNMLHKAAAVAPSRLLKLIPGAALQMQRELQWFKAVEELASPAAREWPNNNHLKPRDLFTENHKDLVAEGEKWMKDTASSSTVVGALIITITFAAAFTFPGGNDQNRGFPMFSNKKLFRVFMMSNAVALFTSITSVLTFLGILTSRYGEEDFLKSLPKKLIIGLSTLFLSIAAMIIAFCVGLSLMFHQELWIVIPSVCLACIPVAFYMRIESPLLFDIFKSTYGTSLFDRSVERWI